VIFTELIFNLVIIVEMGLDLHTNRAFMVAIHRTQLKTNGWEFFKILINHFKIQNLSTLSLG